jgi:cyclase
MPIILAGGVGNARHLADGLTDPRVDAAATAHLLNFVGDGLQVARRTLTEEAHLELARWPQPSREPVVEPSSAVNQLSGGLQKS